MSFLPCNLRCGFLFHVRAVLLLATLLGVGCVSGASYSLVGLTNQIWKYDDSGTNWGAAWKEIVFNDTAWRSGRGVLANESNARSISLTNTILRLTNSTGALVTNFYFRTHFTLTNDPATVSLMVSNLIDDGAIVYLNGSEVYRINMPSGPVDATTLASGGAVEGVFVLTNLPQYAAVMGDNVLAVEVHQVNTDPPGTGYSPSPDVAMGLHIQAVLLDPTPLVITTQPSNVTVEEAKRAVLQVGIQGQPAWFQWYANGLPVSGAVTNPLVLAAATMTQTGAYYVVVTNSLSAVTSAVAPISVTADTNPPVLVDADGTLAPTNIVVRFSEALLAVQATNPSNYRVTNTSSGAVLSIVRAVMVNDTNVVLTTSPRSAGQNYILVANNVRDISPQQNIIGPNGSMPVSTLLPVVGLEGAQYDYYQPVYPGIDPDPDQGTNWRFPGFVPPYYWAQATSPFTFALDTYETPFSQESPPATGLLESEFLITYFRAVFSTIASPGGAALYLRHVLDDGAVFYLNGAEALRVNIPAQYDYSTPANGVIGQARLSDPVLLPLPLLPGSNVFAIELHQVSTLDTDAVFTAELMIRARSLITGPVVITAGPQSASVIEGQPATFSAMQAGGRTFQWQLNSNNVVGATNADYVIPVVTANMDGASFRVIVSNASNTVISASATLHVVPDTNPPVVVDAVLDTAGQITISFSERVMPASAANLANYVVTNDAGQGQPLVSATLTNCTNVVFGFSPPLPVAQYTVVINGIRDAAAAQNVIFRNSTVRVGFNGIVKAFGGSWRYDDQSIDLGSNWTEIGYDDSSWTGTGLGLFGAKRGTLPQLPEPLRTTVALSNAAATAQVPTYYFRTFIPAFATTVATLSFRTIVDDGCVIYVNGVEVFRLGMPAGPVAFNTLANRAVGDPSGEPATEAPFSIRLPNLVNGSNVIAVEVHQASLTSADVFWAGEFSLYIPSDVSLPIVVDRCDPIAWTPPQLSSARFGTNFVLSWVNPFTNGGICRQRATFKLQETPEWKMIPRDPGPLNITWIEPGGNASEWTDVTTNTPFTIPATNAMRFYRLRPF